MTHDLAHTEALRLNANLDIVLAYQRTIASLEQENEHLREQVAGLEAETAILRAVLRNVTAGPPREDTP